MTPAPAPEVVARQRAKLSMTARCCNELLAELDRVADRQREKAERLVSLYEAVLRNHEERNAEERVG